jgi:hypothetical protein
VSADGGVLESVSGVSLFTGEPFVTLRWGQNSGQLTPAEARELAMSILAAAEAAESDAAVVKVLRTCGCADEAIAPFLRDLRDLRSLS